MRRDLEDISLAYLRPTAVTDRPTLATLRLLDLTTLLLPRSARNRWREEWAAEVGSLPTRRARIMFTLQTLSGVPRLAWVLSRPRRAVVPTWVDGLAQIARALGVGGAIVAVTATDSAFAWVAGGIALASLALLGTLLFLRSDDRAPANRVDSGLAAPLRTVVRTGHPTRPAPESPYLTLSGPTSCVPPTELAARNAPRDAAHEHRLNRENSFRDEVWSLRGYLNPNYMITMAAELRLR